MFLSGIVSGAAVVGSKVAFALAPHAPKICLIGGMISGGAALVSAGYDTLHADAILEAHAAEMAKIKEAEAASKKEEEAARIEGRSVRTEFYYGPKKMRTDIFVAKARLVKSLLWHYKRTIFLSLLSCGLSVTAQYLIERELARQVAANAGLIATVTALQNEKASHDGVAAVAEAQSGLQAAEDQSHSKQICEELGLDPADFGCSMYAQPFYAANTNFDPNDPQAVNRWVSGLTKMMDNKLQREGHLYLNEVYKTGGLEQTELGHDHGWIKGNPNGDGHVKITMMPFDYISADGGNHIGYMLDFNCDGDIKHIQCTSKFRGRGFKPGTEKNGAAPQPAWAVA